MPHDPPVLVNLETNEELKGQGVPDQMVHGKANSWAHAGGQTSESVRSDFQGAGPSQFEIELSFETQLPGQEAKDVRPLLKALDKMTKEGENGYPPVCHFSWGTVNSPVFVEDSQVWFTRFDPSGIPTAARVSLRLTEARDNKKLQKSAGLVGGGLNLGAVRDVARTMELAFNQAKSEFRRRQQQVDSAIADAKRAKREFENAKDSIEELEKKLSRLVGDDNSKSQPAPSQIGEKQSDGDRAGTKETETAQSNSDGRGIERDVSEHPDKKHSESERSNLEQAETDQIKSDKAGITEVEQEQNEAKEAGDHPAAEISLENKSQSDSVESKSGTAEHGLKKSVEHSEANDPDNNFDTEEIEKSLGFLKNQDRQAKMLIQQWHRISNSPQRNLAN